MTTRRRVLFAIPSMGLGGAERVFSTLLGSIDPKRYDLMLALVRGGGPLLAQVPSHVGVVDLGASRVATAMAPLVGLIRDQRPDVVVSTLDHMNLALCATRPFWPREVRHVIRATSLVVLDQSWRRRAIGLLYRWADAIVFQSEMMQARYEPLLGDRPPLSAVIGNPVDTAAIRRRAAQMPPGPAQPADGLRLVAVGRFEPVKGFDLLVRALARLDEPFTLTIVGDGGPDRAAIEARAAELGLASRVRLVGRQANPYPFIAQSDALVLPSRSEGFPNVVLEALALDVPVVAMPVAGVKTLLAGLPNCVVADEISVNGLAKALRDFGWRPRHPIPLEALAPYEAAAIARRYEAVFDQVGRLG